MFKTEGMEDFRKHAARAVAIIYPKTNKPMLRRADYPVTGLAQGVSVPMWELLVKRVLDEPKAGGVLIYEDSEEGKAILHGTPTQSINLEFLLGLAEKGSEHLREFAALYDVKATEKNSDKTVALKVLAAIADGVKPKQSVNVTV